MMMDTAFDAELLAIVDGKQLAAMPEDLYIPPDALRVLLESFTGPLDLLLYLIKKQNIDILNIPIALITEQYMVYIDVMAFDRLELAADYLVMAATLAEIKARLLLPPKIDEQGEIEEDPRMALVRRLQAYEEMRLAALALDMTAQYERDFFDVNAPALHLEIVQEKPTVLLSSLVLAMSSLLKEQENMEHHQVSAERLSVRERMNQILAALEGAALVDFKSIYQASEGRLGVVVSFLAILELSRLALIVIIQVEMFSPIYLQAASNG